MPGAGRSITSALASGVVARAEPRASRCQHQFRLLGKLHDRIRNRLSVVGNDAPLDLVALGPKQLDQQVAACVSRSPARRRPRP
jgi:hypothetical protein